MKVTNTKKSIKISIGSRELNVLVQELGLDSIRDMLDGHLDDMLYYISDRLKKEKGLDIFEEVEDQPSVNMMMINEILLIEIPKKGAGGDVSDRPEERVKGFLEHLMEVIENEVMNAGAEKKQNEASDKRSMLLYRAGTVGEALSGVKWVKSGRIIRWKGDIYIQTEDMTAGLCEHFEAKKSPVGLQPEEIICRIQEGKPVGAGESELQSEELSD